MTERLECAEVIAGEALGIEALKVVGPEQG